jgi:deferrochelatase/peroxidase EfeB
LAFRQLSQLVPEFHEFLDSNPVVLPGLDRKQGSELLGARLFGRWKSGTSYCLLPLPVTISYLGLTGAPIQVTPSCDDPELAKDPQRNNNFVYPQDKGNEGQSACPYAAHIRKTNPRNDLDGQPVPKTVEMVSITRAGIPYGPGA